MFYGVVAAAFEDVQEALDIGVDVGVRIFNRVAHAGLRGEIDDAVEAFFSKECLHGFAVRDIGFDKTKTIAAFEAGQAGVLEAHVVIGVHVVEADNFVAAIEQDFAGVRADEPGRAGHKNFHVMSWCVSVSRPL